MPKHVVVSNICKQSSEEEAIDSFAIERLLVENELLCPAISMSPPVPGNDSRTFGI